MRRWLTRLGVALPTLLVLALSSCGGGDDRDERPDLITINSTPPTTQATSVGLSGTRSTSVDSVTWSNAAGGSGNATLANDVCGFPLPIPLPCNHRWSASVPLFVGANVITVIGNGGIDEFTRLTVTITRL
jgi:hypothetical protein